MDDKKTRRYLILTERLWGLFLVIIQLKGKEKKDFSDIIIDLIEKYVEENKNKNNAPFQTEPIISDRIKSRKYIIIKEAVWNELLSISGSPRIIESLIEKYVREEAEKNQILKESLEDKDC